MKKLILATILILCMSAGVHAQDAWYEAAESCAVDYDEVSVSRQIPAEVHKDMAPIDNLIDIATEDMVAETTREGSCLFLNSIMPVNPAISPIVE